MLPFAVLLLAALPAPTTLPQVHDVCMYGDGWGGGSSAIIPLPPPGTTSVHITLRLELLALHNAENTCSFPATLWKKYLVRWALWGDGVLCRATEAITPSYAFDAYDGQTDGQGPSSDNGSTTLATVRLAEVQPSAIPSDGRIFVGSNAEILGTSGFGCYPTFFGDPHLGWEACVRIVYLP